jgi:hypothetical protein
MFGEDDPPFLALCAKTGGVGDTTARSQFEKFTAQEETLFLSFVRRGIIYHVVAGIEAVRET